MGHVREHRSILAAPEKQLLIFIAQRIPPSISSDHLTALALAAMGYHAGLAGTSEAASIFASRN